MRAIATIKNRDGARARRDARDERDAARRDARDAVRERSKPRENSASAMDYLRHTRPGFPSGLEVRPPRAARGETRDDADAIPKD